MVEAARTSETSVDNYFTQQYIQEDNSELQKSVWIKCLYICQLKTGNKKKNITVPSAVEAK
jgi:hypothetical protein